MKKTVVAIATGLVLSASAACMHHAHHGGRGGTDCPKRQGCDCKCRQQPDCPQRPDCPQNRQQVPPPPAK